MADEPGAERRAELIAAALSEDWTVAERQEFHRAAQLDPTLITEVAELGAVTRRLRAADLAWQEPGSALPPVPAPVTELTGRRSARRLPRRWLAGVAAGSVLIGTFGTLGVQAVVDRSPTGPPGTLGAYEPVAFGAGPSGAVVHGSLVAHTWGTETVLQIDGLPAGDTYDVVLVDRSGRRVESGTFRGVAATVTCRMNAAILRQQVSGVQILDGDDVVVTATVPLAN